MMISVIPEFEFWQWMEQKRKKTYCISVFKTNPCVKCGNKQTKGCNWEETTLKPNPRGLCFHTHRHLSTRHQNCCPVSLLATWLTQLTCRNRRQQSAQIFALKYDPKGAKSAAGAGIKSNPPRLWSNAGCLWSCVWITALQKRLCPCCSLPVSAPCHTAVCCTYIKHFHHFMYETADSGRLFLSPLIKCAADHYCYTQKHSSLLILPLLSLSTRFCSHFFWDNTEEAACYHLGLELDLHSSAVSNYFCLILPLSTSVYPSAMAFILINL